MSLQIHSLHLGINRCYLIKDKSWIMIDGGPPNKSRLFKKMLTKLSIRPEEIQLILLTHGDFDHVGSAKHIKKLTGAKLAIHELDRMNLEQSIFNFPPGASLWGNISRFFLAPLLKSLVSLPAVKADIVLDDNDFSLKEFGINGTVIYTPGHTLGSVSVLLDTGDAFVGCQAHNNLPLRIHPGLPIYAHDLQKVKESWEVLIKRGAKIIYPAHGNPFSVDVIKGLLPS